jgi:hypothetical protein
VDVGRAPALHLDRLGFEIFAGVRSEQDVSPSVLLASLSPTL